MARAKTDLIVGGEILAPGDTVPASTYFNGRERPVDLAGLAAAGLVCDEKCGRCTCGGPPRKRSGKADKTQD